MVTCPNCGYEKNLDDAWCCWGCMEVLNKEGPPVPRTAPKDRSLAEQFTRELRAAKRRDLLFILAGVAGLAFDFIILFIFDQNFDASIRLLREHPALLPVFTLLLAVGPLPLVIYPFYRYIRAQRGWLRCPNCHTNMFERHWLKQKGQTTLFGRELSTRSPYCVYKLKYDKYCTQCGMELVVD